VASPAGPLFRFVQLELPWELGPPDGRYVIRGHAGAPRHVLVLATLGAPERRRGVLGRRARSRRAAPGPAPAAVTTTRATLVDAVPFPTLQEAERWRAELDPEAEARTAVRALNRVLHAQRTASADAYVREIAREQALVVRVGVGEGEQVAHGRWTDAVELPAAPRAGGARRAAALRPQERLAALLGGRDVALASEELTLRARSDLDAGRGREAALQLRVALEAALAELVPWSDRPEVADRLAALRGDRGAVGDAANMALQGGLDDAAQADVERVVAALEAALRARTASGL
jgi:hypothetical protein